MDIARFFERKKRELSDNSKYVNGWPKPPRDKSSEGSS